MYKLLSVVSIFVSVGAAWGSETQKQAIAPFTRPAIVGVDPLDQLVAKVVFLSHLSRANQVQVPGGLGHYLVVEARELIKKSPNLTFADVEQRLRTVHAPIHVVAIPRRLIGVFEAQAQDTMCIRASRQEDLGRKFPDAFLEVLDEGDIDVGALKHQIGYTSDDDNQNALKDAGFLVSCVET